MPPDATVSLVIEEAALPPAIARRIAKVVRLTRLRRSEREWIAEHLCGEASWSLREGGSEESVLRSLRGPRRRAREFRRRALADSSLWRRFLWRARVWMVRSTTALVVAIVVVYPYLYWRFHYVQPTPSRNFAAEHNALVDSIPPEDRGAETYILAYRALETMSAEDARSLDREWTAARPGSDHWNDAVAYIERNAEAIELIRAAASRPRAGFRLSLQAQMEPDQPAMRASAADRENPPMVSLHIDSVVAFRVYARVMALDARIAALEGDAPRFMAAFGALMGMASHAQELDAIIADLVAIAIRALAIDALGHAIAGGAIEFGRDDLATFDRLLRDAVPPGTPTVNTQSERRVLADHTQRLFTDDGRGNGWFCADGLRYMMTIANQEPRLSAWDRVLWPLSAGLDASRREFEAECDKAMAAVEADASQPLWTWRLLPGRFDEALRTGSPSAKRLLRGAWITVAGMGRAAWSHEVFLQERDAALVLIALARHRLDHGEFPASLDALVPTYLDALPPDRYDGGPIKHRVGEDGLPVLYSVGRDRRDDGGVPSSERDDGTAAKRWATPGEGRSLPPGDWILFPRLAPPPEADDDE